MATLNFGRLTNNESRFYVIESESVGNNLNLSDLSNFISEENSKFDEYLGLWHSKIRDSQSISRAEETIYLSGTDSELSFTLATQIYLQPGYYQDYCLQPDLKVSINGFDISLSDCRDTDEMARFIYDYIADFYESAPYVYGNWNYGLIKAHKINLINKIESALNEWYAFGESVCASCCDYFMVLKGVFNNGSGVYQKIEKTA